LSHLDTEKRLKSDLWLDQPDAHEQIDARVAAGRLDAADAGILHRFTDEGFARLAIDLGPDIERELDAELDRLWTERPADLAIARSLGGRVSIRDAEAGDRKLGYRIPDMHGHSELARRLYVHPEVMRVVELIFDDRAIAFQSLLFQFGSQQALHRDPMFVVTEPPSHLMAAWIALEDVGEDCGPLLYAPGSHRMPWYDPEEGKIAIPRGATPEMRAGWVEFRSRMIEELGLEVKSFTCARGDVFIWHGGLLHGGKRVKDQQLTRKSFVTHYGTAAHYRSRRATMKVRTVRGDRDRWVEVEGDTTDTFELDGYLGLDAPLKRADLSAYPRPNGAAGEDAPPSAAPADDRPATRPLLERIRTTLTGGRRPR
jgi:hypothetical protein